MFEPDSSLLGAILLATLRGTLPPTMQGSRSVRECVAETQGGQRVQVCHWVLGSDSDNLGWV